MPRPPEALSHRVHDILVGWEPPFEERRFPNPPSNLFVPLRISQAAPTVPAVADHFGISRNAVSYWGKSGIVPAERVVDLCNLTGGFIKAPQLRPDVFKGDYAGV